MIRFIKAAILSFAVLLLSLTAVAQVRHVILISVDGLRPEMYLDKSWPAENLHSLMNSGTYADHMLSVFPSYTYPSHTAMLTGALPARSGIYFNQPKNGQGEWNWFMSDIRVPTLWQALKTKGLKTAAVEWPVSVGQGITWNIPEIWSDQHPDRITESRQYATQGLVEEIEKFATGKLDSYNMDEESSSMDDNSARMAAYIFRTKKPALLAVHFAGVDGAEHAFGRDADSVHLALEAADRAVGILLETVKRSGMSDSTAVIVVGDHGFSDIYKIFRPNLLINGLNARFIAAGGSCFLYRLEPQDKNSNTALVKAATDSLGRLPTDKRKLFRIIGRTELDRMGVDSSALLALAAQPGMVFSGSVAPSPQVHQGPGTTIKDSPQDGLFLTTSGGHHGYDPAIPEMYTGFIAAGAGIIKQGHIKELRVTDIAPLIAALFGVEFNTPNGKLVPGILRK